MGLCLHNDITIFPIPKGPPPLRSSPVDICENYLKFCDYDFWLQKQNLPRKNSRKYVLVIGGFSASRGPGDILGMFGVDDTLESFSCVEKYDTYGGEWEIVASMNEPRSNHCVVKCRNTVYVLGKIIDHVDRKLEHNFQLVV